MSPEIDIHQLPIPAWGLRCPQCDYDLTGLPSHRCPECGVKLDMANVVRPWHRLRSPTFTGRERPLPDFGLECARCDASLVGSEESVCGRCAAPFDLDRLRPAGAWFIVDRGLRRGIPVDLIEAMITEAYIPHAREEDQTFRAVFGLTVADPASIRVSSAFFFDFLHVVRAAEREHIFDVERSSPDQWSCPDCGEENPGHFDICWSCSGERPQGEP